MQTEIANSERWSLENFIITLRKASFRFCQFTKLEVNGFHCIGGINGFPDFFRVLSLPLKHSNSKKARQWGQVNCIVNKAGAAKLHPYFIVLKVNN